MFTPYALTLLITLSWSVINGYTFVATAFLLYCLLLVVMLFHILWMLSRYQHHSFEQMNCARQGYISGESKHLIMKIHYHQQVRILLFYGLSSVIVAFGGMLLVLMLIGAI